VPLGLTGLRRARLPLELVRTDHPVAHAVESRGT
jgi:hypothetical protein